MEGIRGTNYLGDIAVDDISYTQQCHPLPSNVSCNESAFRCKSGECIDVEYRCNFQVDCYDASDEKNCDEGNFLILISYLARMICFI